DFSIQPHCALHCLNCRGLNNPIKRSKIFHYLHHAGAHVIFLQETHLKPSDHVRLKKGWINQTYHSSFSGKARGVAILLHKSVPFVHTSVVSDPNGRFVIVTGQIHNTSVALINIYAPNYDDEGFFKRLFSLIPDLSTHYLILGGDFNCWLNPHLGRSSSAVCAPSRSAKAILSFMKEYAVSDAWRFFNPTKREYSFFFSSSPYLHSH
uniref:exodeoxyribonuclease III n=1 Tax=Denticeps clupeoides TaxID=299321 RepID=A0AAY4F0R4_9TELE